MRSCFVRGPLNYDTDAASAESVLVCGESKTQQQFKDECDINTILKRFGVTGLVPGNGRVPAYGDFTGISDYRSALHAIMEAEDSFMSLPSDVRERFGQDPAKFVDFCLDPANLEEARKLGLAPPAEPAPAPPVS